MDTTDDNLKQDEQPHQTLPQVQADSATPTINTNGLNAGSDAAPEDASAVHPHQETNFPHDSGIDTDSMQSRHDSTETIFLDQPSIAATAALTGFQFAEEQDLTPDVRRIPKQSRQRRRKVVGVEQRYDFDCLTGARQRLGYRERRVRAIALQPRGLLVHALWRMLMCWVGRARRRV